MFNRLLSADFEEWFDSTVPKPVAAPFLDYTLVNEKGKFLYIKALVHATDPAIIMDAFCDPPDTVSDKNRPAPLDEERED
jgi:hypothetical protein